MNSDPHTTTDMEKDMYHDATYDDLVDDYTGPTITFHFAPLIPCGPDGQLDNPQAHYFRIGPFGAGAASPEECLTDEYEVILLDSDDNPELLYPAWALRAWNEIETCFGICHNFVMYRRRGEEDVKVGAIHMLFDADMPHYHIPQPYYITCFPSGRLPPLIFSRSSVARQDG